jgi:hypothetical protein
MAPFNTHFLVAEKLWPELNCPWLPYYGQFCFGCTAPDVDKVSKTLSQKDTHFFDRTDDYEWMASRRSAAFVERQASFLRRPFGELAAAEQAFSLGYLCHLCVDEVSKHMWRRETWAQFRARSAGPVFAALDELARQQIDDYPAIVRALCSVQVPDVIPCIRPADLEVLLRGVCVFARAKSTEAEFLALVDLFDRPTPDQRRQRRQALREDIDLARSQAGLFRLDVLVRTSLAHSRRRLAELVEGRPVQAGYPLLD